MPSMGAAAATQLMARFLIDRDGVVRWTDIERRGQDWPTCFSLGCHSEPLDVYQAVLEIILILTQRDQLNTRR